MFDNSGDISDNSRNIFWRFFYFYNKRFNLKDFVWREGKVLWADCWTIWIGAKPWYSSSQWNNWFRLSWWTRRDPFQSFQQTVLSRLAIILLNSLFSDTLQQSLILSPHLQSSTRGGEIRALVFQVFNCLFFFFSFKSKLDKREWKKHTIPSTVLNLNCTFTKTLPISTINFWIFWV